MGRFPASRSIFRRLAEINPDTEEEFKLKFGIVMEGGASRTIFSAGVCEVLMAENIYPDYFVGVSAGVGYGVSYISRQPGRNKEFTRRYMHTPQYMGLKYLLDPKKKCYYNLDFAFGAVPNELIPFDYKTFAEFPGKSEAVVTNIRTGRPEYLEIPPYETDWKTSIASCSLPVLFPPVKIGHNRYLDGGLSDSIPYRHAFEEGCDKVALILTRPRHYTMQDEKAMVIIDWIYRKYPHIVDDMETRAARYNECTKEILKLEKEGKLFIFAPDQELGIKRTEGDWKKLNPVYEEGIYIGRRDIGALKAYLEEENSRQ